MQHKLITYFRPYSVYFAVFSADMLAFAAGVTSNWSSIIVPILQSNDTSINPLPEPPSTLESSWIVSIAIGGALLGTFAGGFSAEKLGKKKTFLLLAIPCFTSQLITAFATQVWMFLIARFMMGFTSGVTYGVMSSYVGDIAENKNRGLLGSLTIVFLTIGGLSVYVIGPYTSIKLFSLLNLIPFILLYTLFGLFVPDTPYDLVQKNSIEEAKKSLAFYKGKNITEIDSELKKLLDSVTGRDDIEAKNNVKTLDLIKSIFHSRPLFRGVKIVGTVVILQELSGMAAVASYFQTIFDESSGSLKSTYSVMIIGVVTFFAATLSSQLIERLGRKVLLLVGFFFMALSLFSLGTYFLLQSQGHNTDQISWLPLVSLIIYTIAFCALAGIPWVLLTDIFPSNILGQCTAASSTLMFIFSFIVSLTYPYLKTGLGNYGPFYLFGACMIYGVVFAFLFVPETKGRSIEEVHEMLNQK